MNARCPLGHRCESCGVEAPALSVAEVATAAGAVCVTLCPRCRRAVGDGTGLPITVATAGRLAAQHRAHLDGETSPPAQWSARGHLLVDDAVPTQRRSGVSSTH